MAVRPRAPEGDGRGGAGARDRRAHVHAAIVLRFSSEVLVALNPRAAYARLAPPRAAYILLYVLLVSAAIAVAAATAAAHRVTISLLVSLSLVWMFVPLLHVLVGAIAVAGAPRVSESSPRTLALLLMGHVPWTCWLLAAGVLCAVWGYSGYRIAVGLALVPFLMTVRILIAFGVEVLGMSRRAAATRAIVHQAATWLCTAIYIERAVSLTARVGGWLP